MLDALLDKAPCGFVSLSDDGTVLRANSTLAGWLGTSSGDLVGRRFETLLTVGGKLFYQTHFFPLLKLSGHREEFYLALRARDGKELPVLVNAVRIDGVDRAEYSVVLVPMHQRERFEEELLQARRAAEEANTQLAEANLRLRDLDRLKDELLAVTSHDIGGLATAIRLSAQMFLRQQAKANVEPSHYLRAIEDSSDRLLVLLKDLSDITLINTGKIKLEPTRFLLSEVAQAVLADLGARAEAKSITLSLASLEDEPYIEADHDRLYQVISNLVGNAIKFTPAGGQVVIKVQNNGERIALSIQDTGIGIPSDKLPDLFANFKTESRPGTGDERGSGLGLAIARRFVELHGGELIAESVEGSGSTFTILLSPDAD